MTKPIPEGLTLNGFRSAMEQLDFKLRFNERTQLFQYKNGEAVWQNIDEHAREYIALDLFPNNFHVPEPAAKGQEKKKPFWFSKDLFSRCLFASTHLFKVDPFKEYLEQLPDVQLDANQIANYELSSDKIFEDLFAYEPANMNDRKFVRWVSRMITLAPVHRTMKPGCKFDNVLVVTGPQGAGKDTLFSSLVPDPSLHTTSLSFSDKDANKVEKCLGKAIVVASEMSGLIRDADIDSVKQWITTTIDRQRLAYRRDVEEIPRRFVVVCTSNADQPLPQDATGNRRWCVVQLDRGAICRVEDWVEQRRDEFWANAVALYKSDSHDTALVMPHDIGEIQASKNLRFSKIDEAFDSGWHNAINKGVLLENHPYQPVAIAMALGIIDDESEWPKVNRSFSHRMETLMTGLDYRLGRHEIGDVRIRVWWPKSLPNDKNADLDEIKGLNVKKRLHSDAPVEEGPGSYPQESCDVGQKSDIYDDHRDVPF